LAIWLTLFAPAQFPVVPFKDTVQAWQILE